MPRPRLVILVLFSLVACSGGGPAPAPPATPTKQATSTPSAAATPRALVERNRTLYVVEAGGRERRVSAEGFYPGGNRSSEPPLSVSPDRRWVLAYTATRPGWFVLPLAGGPPLRLPGDTGAAKLPTWSPDSTIAWVADGDLRVAVPGRSAVTVLAPAPEGCCFGLAWSPDGRRIAMEGFDRTLGHEQIWVVSRTGKDLTKVWSGRAGTPTKGWALGFSPDGERLVSGNAAEPVAIQLGGAARELDGEPVLGEAGWTWWRNRILVHTREEPPRLAWEDPGGGPLITLAEPVAFATLAAVAPSGSPLGITLMRREDSKTALFTVRPDGTALTRLTDWGSSIASIGWTRDGGTLVFELAKSHEIRALRIAGKSAAVLGTGRLRAVL